MNEMVENAHLKFITVLYIVKFKKIKKHDDTNKKL